MRRSRLDAVPTAALFDVTVTLAGAVPLGEGDATRRFALFAFLLVRRVGDFFAIEYLPDVALTTCSSARAIDSSQRDSCASMTRKTASVHDGAIAWKRWIEPITKLEGIRKLKSLPCSAFKQMDSFAMVEGTPTVLVIGAGAVGALFGSALARQGVEVSVVCRSDYDAVSRDGYFIRSETFGDHTFRPVRVYRNSAECVAPPDYVLLTVKVLPSVDRVALLRPVVGPSTTIVLIENGIDIEEEIASAFAGNEILSSLAFVGVGRGAPGEIVHQSFGSLVIGRYPSGIGAAAERLAALFVAGGVPCKLTDNVVSARWQKAVWNAPFNPISILGGVLDTAAMLRTEGDRAFIRQAMQEVCNVAAAAGCPQSPKLIDAMIANTSSMPAYKTSMALDYENARPMEVEAILGNVVRSARKLDVATPALDAIYALAKMVEGARQQPSG